MLTRQDILTYVNKKYKTISEKPWAISPKNEVLRHKMVWDNYGNFC